MIYNGYYHIKAFGSYYKMLLVNESLSGCIAELLFFDCPVYLVTRFDFDPVKKSKSECIVARSALSFFID